MINKPWNQITKEDIERLVAEAVPESHTLDYKQEMPNESPKSKLDFLADIVAFANASGGDLIFGIEEQRVEGKPTAMPQGFLPLRIAGTWDEAKRRLESLIRAGIDPTLSAQMNHFDGLPQGPVFVVRVPASFAAPHMVTLYTRDHLRPQFYKRHNGGNHPMDAGEIRAAFTLSGTRIERLRRFRDERLSLIRTQDTSVPIVGPKGAKYVLHLLPITAFDPALSFNISSLGGRDRDLSVDLSCYTVGGHFNFDGYLLNCYAHRGSDSLAAYVQVFRHGAIETGKALAYESYIDNDVEASIIRRVKALLNIQRELGVEPPVFVGLSFLEVKGCPVIPPSHVQNVGPGRKIDRDFLPLPECMLEEFDTPVERALRPAFDALYQSSGKPRSYNYDESGNWIGQKIN
jgi:hypothetical protein